MTESVNFDRASEFYDATRSFPASVVGQIGPFLAQCGNFSGDETVLEVGIGTGRIALPLAPHVGRIYGADISAGMLQKLLQKRNEADVFPVVSDAHDLPYPTKQFDACIVTHVFHLVADAHHVLKEIARVLKPGGILLHTFNRYPQDESMRAIADAWRDHSIPAQRSVTWNNVDDMFSQSGWAQLGSYQLVYTYETCPQDFLDRVEKRQWSSTWHMSDEDLAAGVASIKATIDTHYDGDPYRTVETSSTYHVDVYQPPQGTD